jgi:hypothetical protein
MDSDFESMRNVFRDNDYLFGEERGSVEGIRAHNRGYLPADGLGAVPGPGGLTRYNT